MATVNGPVGGIVNGIVKPGTGIKVIVVGAGLSQVSVK